MRFLICLIVVFAIGGLSSTVAMTFASECDVVRGTVEARIIGATPSCPTAIVGEVFDESGIQIGTTSACLINAEGNGNALHADLTHQYAIGNLNFTTVEEGVLTLIAPDLFRFENRLTIVDGASGFLRAHGTVNMSSGEINLAFNGQICVE